MTDSTSIQLSSEQRRTLKARAHHLEPVVIIGDAGLTPAVILEIDVHLKSHELIKVRVAGDDRDARAAMINTICESLHAGLVQHIGKTLIVFRPKPRASLKTAGTAGTQSKGTRRGASAPAMPSKRKHAARKGPRRTKRSYQGSK
jgi:RNA-binding protein